MMAPVVFYLFLNSIGTLVIGDKNITTLVFDDPVTIIHHGLSKSDLYVERSPDRKMVFIKSYGLKVDTNLNIPTKSGRLYTFRIKNGSSPHSIVQVKNGKRDSTYKRVLTKDRIEIEEGLYSLRLTNNRKDKILVNNMALASRSQMYLPKGPAVFINSERFYK